MPKTKKKQVKVNKDTYDFLYDLLFHYNCYLNKWFAFRREDYMKYFGNWSKLTKKEKTRFISGNTVEDLLINKLLKK